jgi:hypothetical protein
MKTSNRKFPGVTPAIASIVATLAVWGWILTRPKGSFEDQGGMLITLLLFPGTFVVWLLCGLTAVVLLVRGRKGGSEGDVAGRNLGRGVVVGLIALGFFLSVGTLFIA